MQDIKKIEDKLDSILNRMQEINYGWVDKYGVIHKKAGKEFFINNYRLQTIEDTLKYKVGTCWEQTELVRYYLEKENINVETYIIIYNDDNKIARHSIAVANINNNYYWMESSWKLLGNSYKFKSIENILDTIINLFPKMYKINDFNNEKIEVYKYNKPNVSYSYDEFTNYCKSQIKIR